MLNRFCFGARRIGGGSFLEKVEDLINPGSEKVQRREDAAVRAEVVLFHDFFVVYRVPDIDVAVKGDITDGGIEVDYVGGRALGVEMRVDSLHKGCFARTWGGSLLGNPRLERMGEGRY